MRLRNIPGARDYIAADTYVVQEPKNCRGRWHEILDTDRPIHIEIGTGKGRFMMDLAAAHPDICYIGIEKYSSVLLRALQKQEELKLPNLVFLRLDADEIAEVFDKDEVDRIYLNFSDPWPKDRHAKRRLTSRQFLARYQTFLKKNGCIAFKTDNVSLFDFSLEEAEQSGWTVTDVTRDLHHSPYMADNIMTEYEERFSAKGNAICRAVFLPPAEASDT